MTTEKYVVLTGAKNNAGDFLIKYRGIKVLQFLRPDREIIDMDRWYELTDDQLSTINQSKALILLGGPSLQKNMYPIIYPLVKDLNKIKVPIITMGIGWKSVKGNWEDSFNYFLTDSSKELLEKIENSGYFSSVRDYHTQNSLHSNGFSNFLMTGCPAYYSIPHLNNKIENLSFNSIGFSLGVGFVHSKSMEKQMKELLLSIKSNFPSKTLIVAFHHSLKKDAITKSYKKEMKYHLKRHIEFSKWLDNHNIEYKDISGSAENLIDFYNNVDCHIGYRVHAHIYMSSINKFSVLITEDGRGKATEKVIGGNVIDGYSNFKERNEMSILDKIKYVTKIGYDRYDIKENITEKSINILKDQDKALLVVTSVREKIDENFQNMEKFISQLP